MIRKRRHLYTRSHYTPPPRRCRPPSPPPPPPPPPPRHESERCSNNVNGYSAASIWILLGGTSINYRVPASIINYTRKSFASIFFFAAIPRFSTKDWRGGRESWNFRSRIFLLLRISNVLVKNPLFKIIE